MSARTIDLCAGPGGWDEGARQAGLDLDIEGVELAANAVATARAAGFHRIHEDMRATSLEDYADATGLIASTPCPTFSAAGRGTGRGDDYQRVLDSWTSIGWGIDPQEAVDDVFATVEDPRTALLALAGLWALSLPSLEWIAMEQVPAVEFAWEDLGAELYSVGWESVDVQTIDAMDLGVPSRRRRTFLVASHYRPIAVGLRRDEHASMADALGWPAGHTMNTRGVRRTSGGNDFSADGPSWCLTGRSRTWARDDGLRLTAAEAGLLNGFPLDYPWTGSRTSQFQQAGDVVSPPVAAHLLTEVAAAHALRPALAEAAA
ncbi:C-5 cytosine-specific DNA methylase [Rathayibacter sp. VKM Ac-2804]|uniref:DNA cytosine methyltransferase n=1 Tax=Rathayibacter sp. VKM Ac-2804 TaxID=2609257 RepID=UPI00132E807D|nr:DNA cytosine methyltransferase [Rathayibacter sp. VKM Ac-2804]QHF24121.1 C-5 cytosine-specific DNA methylase [Rathayibacter sp. VKM Ac-2804]